MLKGKKVKLRPMEESDIAIVSKLRNSEMVLNNLCNFLPINDSLLAQEEYFRTKLKVSNSIVPYFVITTLDDETIGTIHLKHTDYRCSNTMIGLFVREDFIGEGYGTDAVIEILKFIFNEMNLMRVYLEVFAFNERAIKSYIKAGFKVEGTLRDHLFRDGKYHDVIQMSILRDEFVEL